MPSVSRRTVVRGTAWATPAVIAGATVPALAASPDCARVRSSWDTGLGGFAGFPFRTYAGEANANTNQNSTTPLSWDNNVDTWTYEGGLPDSLIFDLAKKVVTGTPRGSDVGDHTLRFNVRLKDGTQCTHTVPLKVASYPTNGRFTENWGGGKQTANVIGVHWLNTYDSPICGHDFHAKIWLNAVNADGSPKTRDVTMIAAPLSSVNLSSYSTNSWSVSSPANNSLEIRDWDGLGNLCNSNKLGFGGHYPLDKWNRANVIRYLTAYAGVSCTLSNRRHNLKDHGIQRLGQGFWEVRLMKGACIQPGEMIHMQVAQVGPNTVPWQGELEVNTPYGTTKLSSVNNTYGHWQWDQPHAKLYTPLVNGGHNGMF